MILKIAKTKTFWSGLALIAYGLANLKDNQTEAFNSILTGLSFIFLRDALSKKE